MRLLMENALLLLSLIMFTIGAEDKLPSGVDRRMYCETCLSTVQELKKAVKVHNGELSRTKIKAEMGTVCESPMIEESRITQARTACKHLLDLYEDKFEEVLLTEKEDTLEANLCYIYTRACTGVKREASQEQRFEDRIIEELIKKHGDRVRRAKPTFTDDSTSLQNMHDEL